jgi:hypothetical protein
MELQLVIENKLRRQRQPKPVKNVADEEFNLFIYKENWTIVSALSRLTLWDSQRTLLCRKSNSKSVTPYPFIDESAIDLISRALIRLY